MTAYTTIFSAPPNVGNFLVGDTMTCPVTSPVQNWIYCGGGTWAPSPKLIKRFPTWPVNTGCLLASLVTSSTASRTSNVVTITATGHAITAGATFAGFRFYYPGSPSLAAGWYDNGLTIPDANTITFFSNGSDFSSESINSGSAWTTATDVASFIVPGGTLRDGSRVSTRTHRISTLAGATKTVLLTFGGSTVAHLAATSVPIGFTSLAFSCIGTAKQYGQVGYPEGVLTNSTTTVLTKDITVDQALGLRASITAASDFIAIAYASVEITQ